MAACILHSDAIKFHHVASASEDREPCSADYVALGDSYSSGTGLQAYRDTTTCYRSNLAWPVQLSNSIAAKQGKAVKFTFPACSGAKTADVRANQLSQVTSKADLVTMTIGGNDLGFSTVQYQY